MMNNEPVEEDGDEEEEEEEEIEEEASNTSPSQLAQPPSVTQSTSSLASTGTQGSTAPPQLNDAFAYLDKVRNEFADQPEIYNKFLQTMREFKANT